jgi:four helix bundle protein
MKTFEDLRVFQAAMDLRVDIHRMTESFPKHELFGIVSQLRRAAGAVVRDIAEGQGRLTYGEWRLLLSHARGSLYEVEAELIAAWRLDYIDEMTLRSKQHQTRAVGQMLMGLIRYVQQRDMATRRRPGRNTPGNGPQATINDERGP